MKVTIRIEDIEVIIERSRLQGTTVDSERNLVKTVDIPFLEAATAKAKELHDEKLKRFK